jgi:predicted Zn-dependent protease
MSLSEREARLLEIGQGLVRTSAADETEVLLGDGRAFLTRFSRNRIHQNVGTEEAWAVVRVTTQKRVGVATASSLAPRDLAGALESALAIARVTEPVEDWPGLPGPHPVRAADAYDEATAADTPDARAARVAALVAEAAARRGEAAGALETEDRTTAVANSRGVAVTASLTRATLHTVVTCEDGSGYAEACAGRVGDLDAARVGRVAARRAADSRKPQPLPPGRYDVVLDPAAAAEWVQFLSYMAFSGKLYDEGQSPLCGKLGARVTGEAITIWDDACSPRGLPEPFDFEGMPARRTVLVDRGVAKAVATNYYRARRLGKRRSTGHALPASTSYECIPMHLFMGGGRESRRSLLAGLGRGLLVTRFHYTNILDPMKTVLTGMTRDGTFLVEDGRVVGPVRNLRYTENVLEALGRADGLSRERVLVRGPCVVPAMRVRGVQFTGTTEF